MHCFWWIANECLENSPLQISQMYVRGRGMTAQRRALVHQLRSNHQHAPALHTSNTNPSSAHPPRIPFTTQAVQDVPAMHALVPRRRTGEVREEEAPTTVGPFPQPGPLTLLRQAAAPLGRRRAPPPWRTCSPRLRQQLGLARGSMFHRPRSCGSPSMSRCVCGEAGLSAVVDACSRLRCSAASLVLLPRHLRPRNLRLRLQVMACPCQQGVRSIRLEACTVCLTTG